MICVGRTREEENLRKIVDYLYEKGLNKTVELPQIAVMGDTSSGKSSLLSALSTVQFPSSDQITTRCPTRLHMEKSMNGKSFAKVDIIWTVTVNAPQFESKTLEGADLGARLSEEIARAQEFILKASGREVSEDVIQVTLCDPDCLDLTLIDLPGIVRTSGKGESNTLGEEIQNLINVYLKNERCIILAVIPANVDFHNSQIMAEARQVDPSTTRTLPVINKPDLIDAGAEGGVCDLLLGHKTDNFALGFHIVRCRGQKDLKDCMSVADGLKKEEIFFRVKEPWSHVAEKDLMGVPNLKKKLALLQIEMLQKTVPTIVEDITKKKLVALDELRELGFDLSNEFSRRDVFQQCVQKLLGNIELGIRGGNYKTRIWEDEKGLTLRSSLEELYEKLQARLTKSDICRLEGENGEPKDNTAWLLKLIEQHRRHELPIFLSTEVFNSVVHELIEKDWKPACDELADKILTSLDKFLRICVRNAFQKISVPSVEVRMQKCVLDILEERGKQLKDRISIILEDEGCQPYTQNHYLFENIQKKRQKELMDAIRPLATTQTLANDKTYSALTNPVAVVRLAALEAMVEKTLNLSCKDHVAKEMENALIAYGKVALKRVMDMIPMACESIMKTIVSNVEIKLKSFTDRDLTSLLAESQALVLKRKNLKEKIQSLEDAEQAIEKILGLY